MKISEVREHELYTSSSLLIILINLLSLIFFYADLGPQYSKFRRDALLIIFMLELGIVSVYIARIYKNQIARKIFIIDKKNSNL